MLRIKEYTLYKGDEILASGTLQEIAKKMKVKVKTLHFYKSPTYLRRTSEKKGRRLVEC